MVLAFDGLLTGPEGSKTVVLNRSSAEPLGATEISKSATNFLIFLVFTRKFQLRVPPHCLKTNQGCSKSKKVEKHWPKGSMPMSKWVHCRLKVPQQVLDS